MTRGFKASIEPFGHIDQDQGLPSIHQDLSYILDPTIGFWSNKVETNPFCTWCQVSLGMCQGHQRAVHYQVDGKARIHKSTLLKPYFSPVGCNPRDDGTTKRSTCCWQHVTIVSKKA